MIKVNTEYSTVFYKDQPPCVSDPVATDNACYYCGASLKEQCRAVYEPNERRTGDDK